MDKIYIRNLALRCIIGVYPEERTQKQEVIINVTLSTDLRRAGQTDDLNDTVNYKALKLAILDLVEASSYELIESLAERTAELCLTHTGVQSATVSVDKPGALRFCTSVAVEVTRP
jgi:FolB domain-containing protein